MLDNAMVSRIRFRMRQTLVDDPEKASPGLSSDETRLPEAFEQHLTPCRPPQEINASGAIVRVERAEA
jgi:hypothetical protein